MALTLSGCAAPQQRPTGPAQIQAWPPPPDEPRYYFERTLFSSMDVVEETSEDQFRRFATGEALTGRGLDKPFGVLAIDGRVFVGDTVSQQVFVFDFPRRQFYEFGQQGMGRLVQPLGMAADRVGHIYVCDGSAHRINVYALDGAYIKSVGSEELLENPSSVAVNSDGSRIYVVDTGRVDSDLHRVRVFDGDGRHLFDIGRRGPADGEFNLPLGAAVGPNGLLHVVDTGNFRVQVFSPDGHFLTKFGGIGRRPGNFAHPKGITIDGEGKIFVTDTAFGNFQIFDQSGRILMFVGNRNERGGPGQFVLPAGITVDVDGRVYVVDQFFRKIDVFRPATLAATAPIGQPPGPAAVPIQETPPAAP
ncbi:MAG: hypothetical protein ACKVP3_01560 [Hyphomicrobiaceae bacterium]